MHNFVSIEDGGQQPRGPQTWCQPGTDARGVSNQPNHEESSRWRGSSYVWRSVQFYESLNVCAYTQFEGGPTDALQLLEGRWTIFPLSPFHHDSVVLAIETALASCQ